jgi:hypothetical protein
VLRTAPASLQHLKHLGDWHVHPTAGSTLPSRGDAMAWASERDAAVLARYVGVIVSPSEDMGWMSPVYSAWTVRREGPRALPVCEPARLDY